MENLKGFAEVFYDEKFGTNYSEKKESVTIKQNDRNRFKKELMQALLEDLGVVFDNVGVVDEGIAVELPNAEEGSAVVVFNCKFKNLDYDFDEQVEAYAAEVIRKEKDKLEREQARRTKFKNETEAREKRKQKQSEKGE